VEQRQPVRAIARLDQGAAKMLERQAVGIAAATSTKSGITGASAVTARDPVSEREQSEDLGRKDSFVPGATWPNWQARSRRGAVRE